MARPPGGECGGPPHYHGGSRVGGSEAAAPLTPPPFPDPTRTSPPCCSHKVLAGPCTRHRGLWAAAGALHTVPGALSSGSPTPSPSRQLWAQAVQVGKEVRPAAGRRDMRPAGRAPALELGARTLSTAPTRGVSVQDRRALGAVSAARVSGVHTARRLAHSRPDGGDLWDGSARPRGDSAHESRRQAQKRRWLAGGRWPAAQARGPEAALSLCPQRPQCR